MGRTPKVGRPVPGAQGPTDELSRVGVSARPLVPGRRRPHDQPGCPGESDPACPGSSEDPAVGHIQCRFGGGVQRSGGWSDPLHPLLDLMFLTGKCQAHTDPERVSRPRPQQRGHHTPAPLRSRTGPQGSPHPPSLSREEEASGHSPGTGSTPCRPRIRIHSVFSFLPSPFRRTHDSRSRELLGLGSSRKIHTAAREPGAKEPHVPPTHRHHVSPVGGCGAGTGAGRGAGVGCASGALADPPTRNFRRVAERNPDTPSRESQTRFVFPVQVSPVLFVLPVPAERAPHLTGTDDPARSPLVLFLFLKTFIFGRERESV